jgi:hypothetical protein
MSKPDFSERNLSPVLLSTVLLLLFLFLQGVKAQSQTHSGKVATRAIPKEQKETRQRDDYVGSQECALCHQDIYDKYSRTDMGRSMLLGNVPLSAGMPTSASIFDPRLNRHFELGVRDGNLYQSEYELSAEGKEVFRETHKIDWIIGAGVNGAGGLVRSGNYLVEAPLSFYSAINAWELSPGYQFGDYGFSRPILPSCIVCHSGRPQPAPDGNGRFKQPPFRELAIGCENCHGPGGPHIAAANAETIVNPAKLTGWQADNICLPCHQTGDARVLQAGKNYGDFRPGTALDDTLSIFLAPFGSQSPPQDDLLEHYLSMRLSKCYRASGGKLSCITCHDPHVQPTRSEAPEYFRQRCLTCHTEQSCSRPLAERQHQSPPDDCAGCHMPKREVKVISHSILTNHRIVTSPQEPFPDSAFHMTTADLPDLVQISAPPEKHVAPSPLTLLRAYQQIMLTHPEYRERTWKLAQQLAAAYPNEVPVLQAMADLSLRQKNWDGVRAAIGYLDRARLHGSTLPGDFEQLAKMLIATHQEAKAIEVLQQGISLTPYDAELYRLLENSYASLKQTAEECKVLEQANSIFPQEDGIRQRLKQCAAANTADPQLNLPRPQ